MATPSLPGLPAAGARARFASFLPEGGRLAEPAWALRHRGITVLLWLHVAGLSAFGVTRGFALPHVALEVSIIASLSLLAMARPLGRRARSALATLGLITSSAVLVHFSSGYIEAHFHFFVMLGVISLYQDWLPFSLSVAYVAVHHATAGIFDPSSVFNHEAAYANPVLWAGIHAVFVLGLSVANLITWRASEHELEQRRAAEAESAKNLSLLTATLESTADGILVVDTAGRIAGHNSRFARMWGIPPGILARKRDADALRVAVEKVADPAGFVRQVEDLYARPEAESYDVIELKDGRVFERYSQPQRVGDKVVGRVWSFRDVTEARRAERERIESMAKLADLDRLRELDAFKTQFINAAAHELNTPLTPMRIQMHLLAADKKGQLSPGQEQALTVLQRNFDRFDRLVQDVVNSARIQAGRLGVTRAPLDLAPLARDAARSFEAHAKAAGVTVEARASGPLLVDGDAERLTQVVYNLVNNALKFTPPGGRIVIDAAPDPRGVPTLRVSDTGSGLTVAQMERLFKPFSQVHDVSKNRTGSGLGLYISRSIVELHGGRMWVDSEGPGRGSTFAFELPARSLA